MDVVGKRGEGRFTVQDPSHDRERLKYRRQLLLPRKPGNVTVTWKHR
jgi:hypothetical protein